MDSSNVFYGVLRVVKMTSMAKFNEITKHAKVRDLSLRIPIRLLKSIDISTNFCCIGIMTNSGKCGSINVNVMESISSIVSSTLKILTYGKKGFSLCNKFSGYMNTVYELGSTSSRNLLISSRILNIIENLDYSYIIYYNRYFGMTSRSISCYEIPSYSIFSDYCVNFYKAMSIKHKLSILIGNNKLCNIFDYMFSNILLNALFENDLSECSARIQSLETALKNLETIIEDLRKTYNKRRQGSITNELLEIISSTTAI